MMTVTGRRGYLFLLFFALTGLALLSPVCLVKVEGRSMEPTYHTGQLLLARRLKAAPAAATAALPVVNVDDIVVIQHEGQNLIKRVAMGPGEKILQARNGEWIEVTALPGGMKATRERLERAGFKTRLLEIPPGHIYVLGDNEAHSEDSRHFGPVPVSEVTAVVWKPVP